MWVYSNIATNELYHFGIKGMKWGIRRTGGLACLKEEKPKRHNQSGRGKLALPK